MKGKSSDRIFCSILMQISAAAKYHEVALVVKNLPANTGDVGDTDSIPGLGGSSRGGNGNPRQYSCLENLMDRAAWWATVQGVAKSRT